MLHNLAAVLDKQGSKEEAERIYSRILAKNPDLEDVWFRLGYLRLDRGDYRGGAEAFRACTEKREGWIEAELNLGICCWNMGDQEGATKAFEAVLAGNPDSIDALRGLAALAVQNNNWTRRWNTRRGSSKRASGVRSCSIIRVCCCRNPASWATPSGFYREALQERDQFPEALLNLGHVLKGLGQQDEARDCWKRALEQKPELAENYFSSANSITASAKAGSRLYRRPSFQRRNLDRVVEIERASFGKGLRLAG